MLSFVVGVLNLMQLFIIIEACGMDLMMVVKMFSLLAGCFCNKERAEAWSVS